MSDLAFWLEAIAVGGETGEAMEFFEPLLYFEYRGRIDETIVLRIGFGLEYRPPWAERDKVGAEDHLFDFELEPSELLQAAQSLRAEGKEFPFRPKATRGRKRAD